MEKQFSFINEIRNEILFRHNSFRSFVFIFLNRFALKKMFLWEGIIIGKVVALVVLVTDYNLNTSMLMTVLNEPFYSFAGKIK